MVTKEDVLKALKAVIDPELGINIVDLGLIYEVRVEDNKVYVKMTLSAKGCPLHESILSGAENVIKMMNNVEEANVQIVWDPPWTPDRLSPEAKKKMGYRL